MKLFISYRRSDTREFAGRLADALRQERQIDDIFFDVEDIEAGVDFKTRIQSFLKRSGVCLVLIGRDWRGESGRKDSARIFEDSDFVRLEVREALTSNVKVIPVLVDGASMPNPVDLPEDLQALTGLNAVAVRHESFKRDANFLADAILARKEPSPLSRYWARHPFQEGLVRATVGVVVAALVLLAGAAAYHSYACAQGACRSMSEAVGGVGPTLLIASGVLLAGIVLPLIFRRARRRIR